MSQDVDEGGESGTPDEAPAPGLERPVPEDSDAARPPEPEAEPAPEPDADTMRPVPDAADARAGGAEGRGGAAIAGAWARMRARRAARDAARAEKGAPEAAPAEPRWRARLRLAGRVACIALALAAGIPLLWTAAYRVVPVPGTLLMAQRALEGMEVRYRWRPLSRISPHLARAVIAAEDTRFCAHNGFDFDAIQTVLREAERGGRLRGASTISQQTAKNAFLWPQRSWVRKAGETWFVLLGESLWTKRRTMELYLNIAEWGDGLFGAEAAARARFGKSASELTEREAALLAAVLPNPHTWRLDPAGPYVSSRAGTLQQRMRVVRGEGLDSCLGL